eukprot:4719762-Karenia_brevis.AAC.1
MCIRDRYLSALPDEYIARAILDADVPDMLESLYSTGMTPWIFEGRTFGFTTRSASTPDKGGITSWIGPNASSFT